MHFYVDVVYIEHCFSSWVFLLAGFEAVAVDHNLTPTAPTMSYCSSITSLDEYGVEYCRDLTQRNLSQVADVLRNGSGMFILFIDYLLSSFCKMLKLFWYLEIDGL